MPGPLRKVHVVDSHTGGEPTRVVVAGGPELGTGSVKKQCERFITEFDEFRRAIILEPRGSAALVGALLCQAEDPGCDYGVIFFNNVAALGMCGHGTIGLVSTLKYLGRIQDGSVSIETPVGKVTAEAHTNGDVTVRNVPSYRFRKDVSIQIPEYGSVIGDIAWAGNWFYLVHTHNEKLEAPNVERLVAVTTKIRHALAERSIKGESGADIDHIELFGPPVNKANHSRNFVLCPGKEFDRSPCGTGTSAKLACLAKDGKLGPGEIWKQESILGSVFEASYEWSGQKILPSIRGKAFVTGVSDLLFHPDDPFQNGIVL